MHRSSILYQLRRQIHRQRRQMRFANKVSRSFDVFINHRGIDTKQTVASLLYDHLARLNLHPFLDCKSLKLGDKLFDQVNASIKESKIAVAIFSPNYCESYFCLYELSLINEMKKKVIPIFWDVKPSQLQIVNKGNMSEKEIQKFNSALEETKDTVGLTFDSLKGNWSDVVTSAAKIVKNCLLEVEEEQLQSQIDTGILFPKKNN